MSLEKSIKKLTQVIQAKTGVGPGGRQYEPRDPCRGVIPGDGSYCKCYKKQNPKYEGPCYFQGSNGKCYVQIYRNGSTVPYTETINGDCPTIGVTSTSSL